MAEKNEKGSGLGLAVAGVALTAIGAAAGAILTNKELRGKLTKKTEQALKVVSNLALQAEKGAEAGLKILENKTEDLVKGTKSPKKLAAKKIKASGKKVV